MKKKRFITGNEKIYRSIRKHELLNEYGLDELLEHTIDEENKADDYELLIRETINELMELTKSAYGSIRKKDISKIIKTLQENL